MSSELHMHVIVLAWINKCNKNIDNSLWKCVCIQNPLGKLCKITCFLPCQIRINTIPLCMKGTQKQGGYLQLKNSDKEPLSLSLVQKKCLLSLMTIREWAGCHLAYVRVNLYCQLACIWNHLGTTPLEMSVSMFWERSDLGGETHPEWRWYHPLGWSPRVNKKDDATWRLISLLLDHENNLTSCLPLPPSYFLAMINPILKLQSKTNPLFFRWCLSSSLSSSEESHYYSAKK